jgi:hypothetical protein
VAHEIADFVLAWNHVEHQGSPWNKSLDRLQNGWSVGGGTGGPRVSLAMA